MKVHELPRATASEGLPPTGCCGSVGAPGAGRWWSPADLLSQGNARCPCPPLFSSARRFCPLLFICSAGAICVLKSWLPPTAFPSSSMESACSLLSWIYRFRSHKERTFSQGSSRVEGLEHHKCLARDTGMFQGLNRCVNRRIKLFWSVLRLLWVLLWSSYKNQIIQCYGEYTHHRMIRHVARTHSYGLPASVQSSHETPLALFFLEIHVSMSYSRRFSLLTSHVETRFMFLYYD